jgi:L-lactate dehydrogenase complex protein LldE
MRVALFVTCFNDNLFPSPPRPTVRLLERLGVDVDFPAGQTCCGQMHINTGYRTEAVPLVRRYVESFEGYDAVVAPSASCAGTVAHPTTPRSPPSGPTRRSATASPGSRRGPTSSPVPHRRAGQEDVGAYFPHRVTYHPTCHSLRALHLGDRPYRLLRAVRGLTLSTCRGGRSAAASAARSRSRTRACPVAMGSDKARHVRATGAEVLVSADNSCLTHIGGMLGRERSGVRTLHIAEVLASTSVPRPRRTPTSRPSRRTGRAGPSRSWPAGR